MNHFTPADIGCPVTFMHDETEKTGLIRVVLPAGHLALVLIDGQIVVVRFSDCLTSSNAENLSFDEE